MNTSKTPLERAFELARTGRYMTVAEVKAAMSAEGYGTEQVTGPTLMKQLRGIIAESKEETI